MSLISKYFLFKQFCNKFTLKNMSGVCAVWRRKTPFHFYSTSKWSHTHMVKRCGQRVLKLQSPDFYKISFNVKKNHIIRTDRQAEPCYFYLKMVLRVLPVLEMSLRPCFILPRSFVFGNFTDLQKCEDMGESSFQPATSFTLLEPYWNIFLPDFFHRTYNT